MPQRESYIAQLPEGTVELVAVTRHFNGEWWRPDGRYLKRLEFAIPDEDRADLPGTDYHVFVFRLNYPAAQQLSSGFRPPEPEWSIDLVHPVAGFEGRKIKRATTVSGGGEFWWVAAPMQSSVKETLVSLGLRNSVETQRVHWARFRNVSLNMGFITQVQISAGTAQAEATEPEVRR